jgi:hypothetical protein
MTATDTGSTPPAPGFDVDIKPLFRASDRAAMLKMFDLWSAADVTANGAQIAARLQDGTMPCDGAWPQAQIQLFLDWVGGGTQP